jgi:hypothetical protein
LFSFYEIKYYLILCKILKNEVMEKRRKRILELWNSGIVECWSNGMLG